MKERIITLTDEQDGEIGEELQKYAETLANDRLMQKADREKNALIKILSAKTPEELKAAVAPIIAAEKAKLEAVPVNEEPIKG